MSRTSTYKIWRGMVDRCTNSNSPVWRHYGGRGIVVCERWMHSFTNFFEDMGERPPGLTLDRKNNNAGYYKANCRWIDQRAQSRNKRDNRLLKFRGETKTLMEWQEITGIGRGTIKRRILNGWTVEDALSTPVHSRPEGKPLRHPSRLLDLTGKTFERLTVLERSPTQRNSNSPEWICQCMCGNTVTVIGHLLKSGQTQSCGCLRRGRLIARNTSKRAD